MMVIQPYLFIFKLKPLQSVALKTKNHLKLVVSSHTDNCGLICSSLRLLLPSQCSEGEWNFICDT